MKLSLLNEIKNNSHACVSSLEDISNSTLKTIKLYNFSTSCFFMRFSWGFGEGVGGFFGF